MTKQPARRSTSFAEPDAQLAQLRRGAVEIISERELLEKLSRQQPLVIKAGFDPTAPDLHLGHTVLLRKLCQFQNEGHQVKFLIGDATALIGDPSGRSQTRPVLKLPEVARNAETYIKQVSHNLNTTDERVFQLCRNSDWFFNAKPDELFDFVDLTKLLARYSVARLIERDDFQKRMKAGKEITMLELFYPLMQGYDSVKMEADVELGGTDQKFNLLVGRDLQRAYGQEPQVVMTLPLLIGTDGVNKMSKSLGNHIGITDAPKEMFGKLMSIPDALMESYATLLTDLPWDELRTAHPREAKVRIAKAIVAQYHNAAEANQQAQAFDRQFRDKDLPDDIEEEKLSVGEARIDGEVRSLSLNELYDTWHSFSYWKKLNINSKNELRRLASQRGLKVDGQTVTDINIPVLQPGHTHVLQAGPRRFLKISLK